MKGSQGKDTKGKHLTFSFSSFKMGDGNCRRVEAKATGKLSFIHENFCQFSLFAGSVPDSQCWFSGFCGIMLMNLKKK